MDCSPATFKGHHGVWPIAGRLVTTIWRVFIMFVTFFYLTQLLPTLVAPNVEKPIDTSADIAARGAILYFDYLRDVADVDHWRKNNPVSEKLHRAYRGIRKLAVSH